MYKVGDKAVIAIEQDSNAARRAGKISLDTKDKWIFPVEIIKVGRKYITARKENGVETKFDISNDYREVYEYGGADYRLYQSEDVVIERFLSDKLCNEIRRAFSGYGETKYTLSQLKEVAKILDIKID